MNRKRYISSLIPRIRGVFPIGISIPYIDYVTRWLKFDSSTAAIDQIGDETRPIQPDRCATNDVTGGFVKLPQTLLLTKWAVAIRLSNVNYTLCQFIGKGVYGRGGLHSQSYLAYRGDSNTTWGYWDGNNNTIQTSLDSTIEDLLFYCDGVNIHLYKNGIYKGYITPLAHELYPYYMLGMYNVSSVDRFTNGDNYDYRLWDLTDKTPTEINNYFGDNAPLFHIDTMEDSNDFPYHRWLMNEGAGSTAFDSGTAATKLHGTYHYDDVNTPVDYLHNTTLYPEYLLNDSNKNGYNVSSGVYIPEDSNNKGFDVQGNALVYKGRVKFNAEVQGDGSIDFDPTQWETYYSYGEQLMLNPLFNNWTSDNPDNWTVSSEDANNYVTETVNGCRLVSDGGVMAIWQNLITIGKKYRVIIKITDVTLGSIRLQQGSGLMESLDSVGTFTFTFISTNDTYIYVYRNEACDVSFDTIFLQEVTEHIDAPNRSGNLVVNGDYENGIPTLNARRIFYIRFTGFTSSQTTDFVYNGTYSGRAEGDSTASGLYYVRLDPLMGLKLNTYYYLNMVVYIPSSNVDIISIYNIITGQSDITEKGVWKRISGVFLYDNLYKVLFYAFNGTTGESIYIDDVKLYEVEESNAIGYLPHLFFNRLCYTGNPYNYPEYWNGDADFLLDTDLAHPTTWTDISEAYVLLHINPAAKRYFYKHLKAGTLKHLIVYLPQRSIAENTKLNNKNYIPNY